MWVELAGKSGSLIGGSGSGHASVPRSRASTSPVATRSNASSEIFVRLLLTLFTSLFTDVQV